MTNVSDNDLYATLSLKDQARFKIMEEVRAGYVSTPRDDDVQQGIVFLIERMLSLAHPGTPAIGDFRPEARALVVVGKSGAGKTTILQRNFKENPAFPHYGTPSANLISIRVPRPCSLKQLGQILLKELGYPLKADRKEHVIWALARDKLQMMGVRFVHFDEIQNITTTANRLEAIRINDSLKTFLNDPHDPIALILSGLPEIAGFLTQDPQIRRRARFITLASMTPEDFPPFHDNCFVDQAKIAGLATPRDAISTIIPRIVHAATYQLGMAIEMVQEAINLALQAETGSLTLRHFADLWGLRTGSAATENPFVAPNWHDSDCEAVLQGFDAPTDEIVEPPPKPRTYKKVKRADY